MFLWRVSALFKLLFMSLYFVSPYVGPEQNLSGEGWNICAWKNFKTWNVHEKVEFPHLVAHAIIGENISSLFAVGRNFHSTGDTFDGLMSPSFFFLLCLMFARNQHAALSKAADTAHVPRGTTPHVPYTKGNSFSGGQSQGRRRVAMKGRLHQALA